MTKVFPFLGNTELEVLSVVGSFLLIASHIATALNVQEKVVVSSQYVYLSLLQASLLMNPRAQKKGLLNELKEIWINAKTLPPTIFQIVSSSITFNVHDAYFVTPVFNTILVSLQRGHGRPSYSFFLKRMARMRA